MEEIKFAVENGFKLTVRVAPNLDVLVSWGKEVEHIVILTSLEYSDLVVQGVIDTKKVNFVEFVTEEAQEEIQEVVVVKKDYQEVTSKVADLTNKEYTVLLAIGANTYEQGLPVDTEGIINDCGLSSHAVRGVIGSLYKKGYVERYDFDRDMFTGKLMTLEYFLSEKGLEVAGA